MKIKLSFLLAFFLSAQLVGNDIQWSFPPTTLSNTSLNSSDPQIVIDGNGNLAAAWVENGFVTSSSKIAHLNWTSPVRVSASGASAPRLVSDLHGNLVLIWFEGTAVKGASKTFMGSWSSAMIISNSGTTPSTPALAVDATGDVIAAWARAGNIQTAVKFFGSSWQPILTVSSTKANFPSIAISGSGFNKRAVMAWNGVSGTTNVIYSASQLLTGNWSSPQIISDTNAQAGYASVAMDANSNASAVWYQYTLTGTDYSNVIVQSASRDNVSGVWCAPVSISSPGVRNPATLVARVAYDANGNALAIWNTSFDDMTYYIESALKPVRGNWMLPSDLVSGNLYAKSVDLSVSSFGDALALYMFYNGSSLIIQSSEANISGFLENMWTVPINISNGVDNGFPKTAMTLTGNMIDAAAIWVGVNGAHNVINVATGSRNLPVPPTGLSVVQSQMNFSVFNEFFNTLHWTPSTDPTVEGYLIYRDGILLEQVDAGTVQFVDHNRVQNGAVTYGVASINNEPIQGRIVTVSYP